MPRAKRKNSKRRVLGHARTHGTQSKHIHAYFKRRGEIRDCTEHGLSAGILSERAQRKFLQEQRVSESARPVPAREQRDSRSTHFIPRASREIHAPHILLRARAERFALAHYINVLSRYNNALSTFDREITPYCVAL